MLDKEITSAELNEQLLNDVLERNYYKYFRESKKQLSIIVNKGNICGTHCEVNNNFEDYFQVFDLSNNKSNIKNLIDFYIKNKFKCDINILGDDTNSVAEYETALAVMLESFKLESEFKPAKITLCCHLNYLNNSLIDRYIKDFADVDITVTFTVVTQGKFIDNDSDYSLLEKYESNIDRIICYIKPETIQYQIENSLWWMNQSNTLLNKVLFKLEDNKLWVDENKEDLHKFIEFILDFNYEVIYRDNQEAFLKFISSKVLQSSGLFVGEDYIKCGIQNELFIQAWDNKVLTCPGLIHPFHQVGEFNIDHVKENNVSIQIMKDHAKIACLPKCEACRHSPFCHSFCWARAFQDHGNCLVPIPEFCDIKKEIDFHVLKYCLDKINWTDDLAMTYPDIYNQEYMKSFSLDLRKGITYAKF